MACAGRRLSPMRRAIETALEENLGALEVVSRLTDEHMERIEQILDNKPEDYQGYGKPFWARTVDTLD